MPRHIVRFTGHVQGVGFRMACLTEAYGLNINGHVSNQSDGSVIMDIDASSKDADELIRRIKLARASYLDNTTITKTKSQNRTTGFKIHH
ncbi:MAG: acylphosphatase [Pirellulaceae bacterium]